MNDSLKIKTIIKDLLKTGRGNDVTDLAGYGTQNANKIRTLTSEPRKPFDKAYFEHIIIMKNHRYAKPYVLSLLLCLYD